VRDIRRTKLDESLKMREEVRSFMRMGERERKALRLRTGDRGDISRRTRLGEEGKSREEKVVTRFQTVAEEKDDAGRQAASSSQERELVSRETEEGLND